MHYTDSINEKKKNNTKADNTKDLDNLIEYSDNYSKTSGSV